MIRFIRRADLWGALVPTVHPVIVVRFWQPFRDFKHGKRAALEKAEAEMFGALGLDQREGTSDGVWQPTGELP